MSGSSLSSLPGGGRWALLAALLLAPMSPAGAGSRSLPSGGASGVVSYAEGPPFTVIHADELRTGTRGAGVEAGDILETSPDDFLVVQMQSGGLVGIGPGSSVYFTERGGALRLLVREGWVKADFRAQDGRSTLAAARLAIQCQRDVVVLHASGNHDEIFDEQGDSLLASRGPAQPHADPQMHPGQLITSDSRMEVVVTQRPSGDFLQGMPKPFRDALPPGDAPAGKPLGTQLLRKVNYSDVEGWVNAQADWREGFVPRFRGRLKDTAFFAAMDAHLSQHPEWTLILHPPPPPPPPKERTDLRRSSSGRSDAPRTAPGESADDDEGSADEPPDVILPGVGAQGAAQQPVSTPPSGTPPAGAQAPGAALPLPAGAQAPGGAPQPPAGPRPASDHPPEGPRPQGNAPSDGRRPQI